MEKLNCKIIQDLIPSYVDEICSDDTRDCVEEHIASCENCRQIVAFCKEKGLSGQKVEMKGLDGLKKIKQMIEYMGYACIGLALFVLVFLGLNMFVFKKNFPSADMYFLMNIVCICLIILSGKGFMGKRPLEKKEYLSGVVSVAVDLCIMLIYVQILLVVMNGAERIFGIEVVRIGQPLSWLMAVVYAMHTAFFLYGLAGMVRQNKDCGWLLCLSTAGCFLMLQETVILYRMDNRETLMRAVWYGIEGTMLIGLAGIAACFLIAKVCRKRNAAGGR